MPVVKGGVWTNIEDEILKASVSKYGLNQWARVSSLLARKTPKQCKARWTEWLDPGIRKIEWSKEEDEKLLHLAKLMPTQWRTIAPIVGRTATQCLERYQRLLDEAEARENDELGLGGPEGGEASAPTGDSVRKLRPGELDPDPESKPARPDTIDLDEDEKEMLSEARARLANTQGKKAKRKARERQLEESRRLAVLQKRRELKNAGINIKITTRKKGQMDYNADIPFEKQATSGFYDTQDEQAKNEREREMFDPRKQQLARKRQGDPEDNVDSKRQKQDKDKSSSAATAAAAKAGQMQRIREAEQKSKRRALNLPAPQVSESELEEIVKMGMAGDRAIKAAGEDEEDSRGLVSNYANMVGATPIRTPRAPAQEDHIANEIRNIRALTETQSSLLGGENTPLHEGTSSTGFDGIAPRRNEMVTPNPMATPFRQGGPDGQLTGATPLRTPRDNFTINEMGERQLIGQTPRDIRLAENAAKHSLRARLASLPKPKETDWELELLPSEQEEAAAQARTEKEDQEEIDRRAREAQEAAAAAEFKRQTQVYQRSLPRPRTVDYNSLASQALSITDPIQAMIAEEAALLMAQDAQKYPLPGSKVIGKPPRLNTLSDDMIARARQELAAACNEADQQSYVSAVESLYDAGNERDAMPLKFTENTTPEEYQAAFKAAHKNLLDAAEAGNKLEKKLGLHLGGYQARQKTLKQKIMTVYSQIEEQRAQLEAFRALQIGEDGALARRLETLRDEVNFVSRREREAQEDYRAARDELRELEANRAVENKNNQMHSSLWLIAPSDDHAFNKCLKDLIGSTLPSDFPHAPKNNFIPHVTITSDIDPSKTYGSTPQEWLNSLTLPEFKRESNEVIIELEELEAGDPFFKKVTLRAKKDANLVKLAAKCRQQGLGLEVSDESEAQKWAENEYLPHLSLFYGDIPKDEVQKKIGLIELQLGFELGSLFDCCGGTLAMGAKLVLVDTSTAIEEWKPIAERECPWVMWRMARGLL
ncbi:Pre-mRNA-splicing factor cef1 [Exophiala xenobiotica]|nr:Pre-mRNA-splicing factor cef1 [Exophiala xenobiotica]KAK5210719.1 Pre-mRNA-splicing factor cef1 [Exophiala xenobiotica]KAK5237174.1 Pre-mRNA-splicing factor cef1 [Exophiala xenobiotica]KAK5248718.1 Pre-mRNA-splicing factor cef1 [Exophiala xenobiotica]KAK5331609.1 Pre-mRNA-splicing factor cef1 [Exophiala xenobiotica]